MIYVPLPELPSIFDIEEGTVIGELSPVYWDVTLPSSVDVERIVLNMGLYQRVQKLGAVVSSFIREYQGDVTTITPGISGANVDGTAVASKVSTIKRAEIGETTHIHDTAIPEFSRDEYGKVVLAQFVNKAELANKVSDSVREGKNKEQVWAAELDNAISSTLRQGAKDVLTQHCSPNNRRLDYLLYPLVGLLTYGDLKSGAYPFFLSAAAGVEGLNVFSTSYFNKLMTGDSLIRKKRWSMFLTNHQSDRYLAVNAITRVAPLVSVRK